METNEIIVNLNNNRRNKKSINEFYTSPKLRYYYDIEVRNGGGGGYLGENLNELCYNLKTNLEFFKVKEEKLEIILTSKIKEDALNSFEVLDLDELNLIKSKIYKTFENIHINY